MFLEYLWDYWYYLPHYLSLLSFTSPRNVFRMVLRSLTHKHDIDQLTSSFNSVGVE